MPSNKSLRRQQFVVQAEGYLELGMHEHALRLLTELESRYGLDGQGCYLRGEALRWLERYDEATVSLRQAADRMPENIHIRLALGWCYKRIGRIDLAIDSLEQAIEEDPTEAILHYNLACYWSLACDKNQALDYLAHAFEMDSKYRELVHEEPDFDPIRNDPRFQALTSMIA